MYLAFLFFFCWKSYLDESHNRLHVLVKKSQSFGKLIISTLENLKSLGLCINHPSPPSHVLAYEKCSLLNWSSFLPTVSFLSSLASFLWKSSCMLIFRFGWAYFIINALFKNSKSVHAFIHSKSIYQAPNKCQAVTRIQRWKRHRLSLNFTYCLEGETGQATYHNSAWWELWQGHTGCWSSTENGHMQPR